MEMVGVGILPQNWFQTGEEDLGTARWRVMQRHPATQLYISRAQSDCLRLTVEPHQLYLKWKRYHSGRTVPTSLASRTIHRTIPAESLLRRIRSRRAGATKYERSSDLQPKGNGLHPSRDGSNPIAPLKHVVASQQSCQRTICQCGDVILWHHILQYTCLLVQGSCQGLKSSRVNSRFDWPVCVGDISCVPWDSRAISG